MAPSISGSVRLPEDVCIRALHARDPRFDGIFFVGIISTMIYCRPICPARVSRPAHRRFFDTAAAAECAGFRPCRRCRPELAPGRAVTHAVSRLAYAASRRIAAGALNGRRVADLARDLCVSERHLRRALRSELGVSPVELAQTQRLLLAKRLLTDTPLPVTRIAYASGFQSLRRFNAVFRERYRMPPSALRRRPRANGRRNGDAPRPSDATAADVLCLSLAYRPPLAWDSLVGPLARQATPGVEAVDGARYSRTARVAGHAGVITAEDASLPARRATRNGRWHLRVEVSASLIPALMPLIDRLRRLFDLDAEPTVVDACLRRGGLGSLVGGRPGVRVPGAFDGFETALGTLLRGAGRPAARPAETLRRVVQALGEPIETGDPRLTHIMPDAASIADAGVAGLVSLGVPARRARAAAVLAREVAEGTLRLEPGAEPDETYDALRSIPGIGDRLATAIVMRALGWPDAFPATDPALLRAAGEPHPAALRARAEGWRPWRAYAAVHLRLHDAGARQQEG